MSELAIAIPGFDSVQQAVHAAREYALRNPEAWANAGQRLIHWLRERLIEDATDRVKDEIAELEVES